MPSLHRPKQSIFIVSETGTATTEFTIKAAAVVDGDTESPQTGDNSNLMLWIALMLVSGGALFTMLFIKGTSVAAYHNAA